MIDQVLDILATKRGQRARGNIKEVEIIWNVNADVACEGVVHLVHVNFQHDFGTRGIEAFQQPGRGIKRSLRAAYHQRRSGDIGRHIADVEKVPKQVHDSRHLAGCVGAGG